MFGLFDSEELRAAKNKKKKYENLIEKIDYLMLQIQNERLCAITLEAGYLERNGQPNYLIDDRMHQTLDDFSEMKQKQDEAIIDMSVMRQSAESKLSYAIANVQAVEEKENE
ncbi:hypothetical protein IBB74_06740 [Listeria welshimeri]|uniref:hypothetical protein n=1 Tax=Listeria welshimeri TaxID=1643 RepID=UPI00162466B4|nr:hypothetical protein [Listeria welshimeri]MBC1717247.1 hypothetical protein [Listeria welshimeri]MBC1859781.1 hypothetical protein [Listeria welshimeri]MBC2008717.1 hypothetical protein [Listeria welshimeri]MBC2280643.1 hypothetical protein [Listeria welshimeri]MBC2355493.1 hypothetical protein [Listeria welshimeri]